MKKISVPVEQSNQNNQPTNKMAYEHKEGKGTIFPNDYKQQESHPDFRGKAMWKGEVIEISLWEGETQSGVKKFGVGISEPRAPKEKPQGFIKQNAQAYKKPASQENEDNDPIPF